MWGELAAMAASAALDYMGNRQRQKTQQASGNTEYERQKEFAQNGIRWRVEDAKAAGLHPLYAIGANTPTYSPQAAVGTDYGLSSIGQNISRAIEAGQTRAERAHAQEVQDAISGAQVGLLQAQTRYYDSQADAIGQRAVDNALDYAHQLASNSEQSVRTQSTQRQPAKPVSKNDGFWGKTIPELQRVVSPDGRISSIIISNELHDAVEDIHMFEMLPYIVHGIQVGWKMFGAKDGATLYGYRWHDGTKEWIKDPYYRPQKPMSYDEAFNLNGYGYSKDGKSYHGVIR